MKLLRSFILFIASGALVLAANVQSGPNGGRLITKVSPHAEFFLTADRQIQIPFVDEAGKTVSPADQVVKVTTGQRSAPTTLTFSAQGGVLISGDAVPLGNGFPTVVQIKSTPDAKTVVERFYLNTIVCSGCNNPEYACTCGH